VLDVAAVAAGVETVTIVVGVDVDVGAGGLVDVVFAGA
jgi:hypothetical protein